MKRLFDILFSFLLITITAPIFVIISLIIFFLYKRPIFFLQERAGKNRIPFKIIKFRTFNKNNVVSGKFAYYLRRVKLDELPQLFNILKGDLSFVGPRPLYLKYTKLYNKEQLRRLNVKPGLTGLAQIKGGNSLPWKKKFELDTEYVDNNNFLIDLKIILITLAQFFLNFFYKNKNFIKSEQSDFEGN